MTEIDEGLYASSATERLAALARMAAAAERPAVQGTNTHVHTNYSFSAFRSPAEAAWLAWSSGVEIFGINDHYTIDGHDEFRSTCAAINLPATFSIESVAMDAEAAQKGTLLNDPGNPGRIYLCGKGVTKPESPIARDTLSALRGHQERRNKAMVHKVAQYFRDVLQAEGPTWNDISSQTPKNNTTERHIAKAIHQKLEPLGSDAYTRLIGTEPVGDGAKQQNTIRSALLKAGKPCYVDEDPAAYPALQELRTLYLHLGAIPTYPILGNPETSGEQDFNALCDQLEEWGIFALELIPSRNTDDRVADALAVAATRGWPVFDGTEHNTPVMEPLLTRWGSDPRFRGDFRNGAQVLLGHQALCAQGENGYLQVDGTPAANGLQRCLDAGAAVLEQLQTQQQ